MRVAFAVISTVSTAMPALSAETMAPERQNDLIRKYCAVCHTDKAMNGGLSLEHFDAARTAPSLAAMLLSKLTGGVSLQTTTEAGSSASAAALVDRKMKSGAMGAAGIPIPDKTVIDSLIASLAAESAGAEAWTVEPGNARLTASILREVPMTKDASEARSYRLIVSCDAAAREGFMQLAWSPVPASGVLTARVDKKVTVRYEVKGNETMGNGGKAVTSGIAALPLAEAKGNVSAAGLPLPAETLTISELFAGETVVFPFLNLPSRARRAFESCFPTADSPVAARLGEGILK